MDGLLIDWGGVLTTSMFSSFDAFSVREGLGEHAVRNAFRDQPDARAHLIELETGAIELPEFERRLAHAIGTSPDGLAKRMTSDVEPDHAMRDAVKRFHDAGIKTALVSNSWNVADYDADLHALFDVVVLSQEVGIRKPAPEIYEVALQRLKLPAERCVFVDDLGGNLKVAKQLGMTTIHHERSSDTLPALERLLHDRRS